MYWVWSVSEQGKLGVFTPGYHIESEAMNYGFRHFGSNFEVTQVPTTDYREATKAIKRIRFEQVHNLDIALQRARHQLPKEEVR